MEKLPSQTSVLERFTGEVRERLIGPPALCNRWLGYGRLLLGQLNHSAALGGIDVLSRRVVAPDGTRITAYRDGVNSIVQIVAGGGEEFGYILSIFVETGFMDVRPLTEDFKSLNSYFYYGTRESAALASQCPKWLDELRAVVRGLTRPGAPPFIPWEAFTCGLVRTPGSANDTLRPNQPGIESFGFQGYIHKTFERDVYVNERAQLRYPSPAYATGRLKLYIQALLGGVAAPGYVRADHFNQADPWTLKVFDAVRLLVPPDPQWEGGWCSFSKVLSNGLMVDENYDFWLIFIAGTDISVAKLKLTLNGTLLRNALKKHLDKHPTTSWREVAKTEAYILSGAIEYETPLGIAAGLLSGVKGEPLHEGWKFNYAGDEAQIVTDEVVTGFPYEDEPDLNVIINHTFRRYKIVFMTRDDPDIPFAAILSLEEEVDATPESILWRPDRITFRYRYEWYDWHQRRIGRARGYPEQLEYDAPIYGWYQINDAGAEEFVTLREEYHEATETDTTIFDWVMAQLAAAELCGQGAQSRHEAKQDLVNASQGFYLKAPSNLLNLDAEWVEPRAFFSKEAKLDYDLSMTDAATVASGTTWGGFSATSGCGVGFSLPVCEGIGIYGLETIWGGWHEATYYQSPDSYPETSVVLKGAAVLPFGDGQAAYLIKSKTTSSVETLKHFKNLTGYRYHYESLLEACPGGGGGPLDTSLTKDGLRAHGLPNWIGWEETHWRRERCEYELLCVGSRTFGQGLHETVDYDFERFIDRFSSYPGGPGLYPREDIPDDPYDITQQLGKNLTFFNTDFEYPWMDYPVNAMESFSGDLGYLQQLGTYVEDQPSAYTPIITNTDPEFPIQPDNLTVMESLYTGWA